MNWFLEVIKKYFQFTGRARRKEYWMFTLISLIISWGLQGLSAAILFNDSLGVIIGGIFSWVYILYSLFVLIPSLAVAVRRLHDINKSGWTLFIILLPVIGVIMLLIFLCSDGDTGPNRYGPDPKQSATLSDDINSFGTTQIDINTEAQEANS